MPVAVKATFYHLFTEFVQKHVVMRETVLVGLGHEQVPETHLRLVKLGVALADAFEVSRHFTARFALDSPELFGLSDIRPVITGLSPVADLGAVEVLNTFVRRERERTEPRAG